jgi:hypothetical protein
VITLTFATILLVAIYAHFAGRSQEEQGGSLLRVLQSPAMLAFVFAATFLVLWLSWGAWNPIPAVHDEMVYVLQAQIFARGRWAMPSPPIPAFWEQPHVLVEPVLAGKYFPGHALAMVPGTLLGWPALMPLVLQSLVGVLIFVLARRVASGGVAFMAWVIWLFTPMALYFGASYYSESTTTLCWLAGWYALLRWRESRALPWLLAVAFFTGWDAITRPLTGLAYAIPIGLVVLHDVAVGRRWRQLAWAFALGTAVMAIIPLWSARTTGDWRVTPHSLYTRMYMPYDVLGFGLTTTPPTHSEMPELARVNDSYSSAHVNHFPSTLVATLGARAHALFVDVWGASRGVLGLFALLGLLTMNRVTAFAVASSVFLIVAYLLYATPAQWTLYYYESVPAFAYVTAAGIAWAVAAIGRPSRTPPSASYSWSSPRWTRVMVAGALLVALPGAAALRLLRAQHADGRRKLDALGALLASIPDRRAVLFVRYDPKHNENVAFVRNTARPETERVWIVYDRGERENARLLGLAAGRTGYLFDESKGRTYLYDPHATR